MCTLYICVCCSTYYKGEGIADLCGPLIRMESIRVRGKMSEINVSVFSFVSMAGGEGRECTPFCCHTTSVCGSGDGHLMLPLRP